VLLSLAGITFAINQTLWAGTIVILGALAMAAVAAGGPKHGSYAAVALAVTGSAMLAYVQFVDFSVSLELFAFGLLAAGVRLDFTQRRKSAVWMRAGSGW
jgi:hypothetical protein